MNIAALKNIDVLAYDLQNAYLTAICREKVWTFVGPEFGEEEGTLMICKNGITWAKLVRYSITIQV